MASHIDRRKFNQLTAAAFGGLAAGTLLGCRSEPADPQPPKTVAANGDAQAANADVHLCRGLNDCKGKGKGGDNECRGQGSCASLESACAGMNTCKGLGGCGESAGANECAGKGGCHVPLMPGAWETVRQRLEGEWKEQELAFGDAPAKADKAKP